MGVLKERWNRGKAVEQHCVDCGDWAWTWTQREGMDGSRCSHYEPRCRDHARAHGGETPRRGGSW